MLSDLGTVFLWWVFLLGIGLVFLPLARKIFKQFFDQGYLFAKVLGILVSAYLVWLLASLKLLPFFRESIGLVLLAGLIFNLWLLKKNDFLPKGGRSLVLVWIGQELLFLLTLAAWSLVRGFQPSIQGLEKFMDFGFVNSILRSSYFPPADMWFAGKQINYYYFGHFVTAFLTRLSGLDSAVTYNLMIATLFAFSFALTFSLAGNLIFFFFKERRQNLKLKRLVVSGGLISALLISLGANLHPAYYNLKMGVFNQPYCDGSLSYWYPNATRYIGYCPEVEDKTIHEFPAYSFVVSDLHGHVSDIPFVLLFLALAFNLFLFLKEKKNQLLSFNFCSLSLPISLVLAVMFMTNQWDFPIYLLVLGLVLLTSFYSSCGSLKKTWGRAIGVGGLISLAGLALVLPFLLNFESIAKGIGLVRAHSLPHQLLILWGAPWIFALVFLVLLFREKIKFSLIKKPSLNSRLESSDSFVLLILLVATLLIAVPEIIYLKDIYISSYHRANTMFKLTYQSFIIYCLAIGYIFARTLSSLKNKFGKQAVSSLFVLLIGALIIYPYYSIKGYYGELKAYNYQGLYGLRFLQKLYPNDYQAVVWLNQNLKSQVVVLEAVGDSYTDYNRISMATGLPTIQGWLVHEWLWRGAYDEPGKRAEEVRLIYESKDNKESQRLLEKYQVKYIVVGEMERSKYPQLQENKFRALGKKVFESGKTTIYLLPD
ncbi:MAG TPA: DUF2298 domain-containing protein [Clostridia bacterium]|nr:DUF2298 domain-containing protein [Clostridia bacterium]